MKGYPTDEELELFIKQMEQQELYAPKHMKEEILNQAFPKQTGKVRPESGRGRTISIFSYRLKIIAGMAAAITMLMVIPFLGADGSYGPGMVYDEAQGLLSEERQAEERNQVNINYILNEGTWKVGQKINSWFGGIYSNQEGKYFRDKGGNLYEN